MDKIFPRVMVLVAGAEYGPFECIADEHCDEIGATDLERLQWGLTELRGATVNMSRFCIVAVDSSKDFRLLYQAKLDGMSRFYTDSDCVGSLPSRTYPAIFAMLYDALTLELTPE